MTAPIPPLMSDAQIRPLIGPEIGRGVNRSVHAWTGRDDVVIKVQHRLPCRANHTEWLLYGQMRGHPTLTALFARVWALSDTGRYLVMERLAPLGGHPLPALPSFLADRKAENFGLSATGVKCLDYGDVALGVALSLSPLA